MLTTGATIVAECGAPKDLFGEDAALAEQFEILKEKRYGAAYVYIMTPKRSDKEDI